ncbi:hypothetical protein [Urbifossiella limnaea]|uniref:Lipoprotein n=1 Tax=Urbifossiella limnaea TaxID=2528023 RepID=A0A517XRJ6_9BACT|nr:hypothetical protein [Urbifossiella limnaea]QDU20136.1 hypothetical protein ETAA1_20790 [Urbifossiella limnaea]
MTARAPTAARRLAVLAAALALAPGCKSKDGSTASGDTRPDPLVAGPGRIPRQNIPLPEKGGTAGNRRGDPLLGAPVARPNDRSGYTNDPERWKGGPYVPGPGGTPAALTNRTKDDGFGLKMDGHGGTQLTPTGGSAAAATSVPSGAESLYAELKRYRVDRGDYTVTREGGRTLFQARVPLPDGGVRGYTGAGPTEADAIRHALEQMRGDLGAR